MILFVGQVDARYEGARGVSGVGLPRRVRQDDEMGGGDRRRRRASRKSCRAPSTSRPAGGPGPVVIALPGGHADASRRRRRRAPPRAGRDLARPVPRWRSCRSDRGGGKPIVHPGRQPLDRGLRAPRCARFAERLDLPVAATLRRQMLFSADHPNYAGDLGIGPNPKLRRAHQGCRSVVVGRRTMGEMPSRLFAVRHPRPQPEARACACGAEELGRVYRPHARDQRDADRFRGGAGSCSRRSIPWSERDTQTAHADIWPGREPPTPHPGAVQMGEVMVWLREHPAEDTIVSNGAGNYAAWVHRFCASAVLHAACADLRLDGLRRAGGVARSGSIRTARSWRSPAMAIS